MPHNTTTKRRPTTESVDEKRRVVAELRAAGLTLAAIGQQLGLSRQRVHQLSLPVPTNLCRVCGQPIPRQKQYHPECRPSNYLPNGRTRGPKGPRHDLAGQTFGAWQVLRYVGKGGKWMCRCRCGVEREVDAFDLRSGKSRACSSCANKAVWAKRRAAAGRPPESHGA